MRGLGLSVFIPGNPNLFSIWVKSLELWSSQIRIIWLFFDYFEFFRLFFNLVLPGQRLLKRYLDSKMRKGVGWYKKKVAGRVLEISFIINSCWNPEIFTLVWMLELESDKMESKSTSTLEYFNTRTQNRGNSKTTHIDQPIIFQLHHWRICLYKHYILL